MIPLEDFTEVTLAIEDTDDHDDRKSYLAIKKLSYHKKLPSHKKLSGHKKLSSKKSYLAIKVILSLKVI